MLHLSTNTMQYLNRIKGIRICLLALGILTLGPGLLAQAKKQADLSFLQELYTHRLAQIGDIEQLSAGKAVPESWMNNSAVVLLDYTRYFVEDSVKTANYGFYSRTRVLLNDLFAVNDFSSFNLEDDEWFELRVYKKNGTVIHLDRSRAVEGDVRVFNSEKKIDYSYTTETRVPVPNLEIGDIVEYERFWENIGRDKKGKNKRHNFKSRYSRHYLNETFPVLKRVIDIDVSAPYYVKWQSLNEAPELTLLKEESNKKYYRFVDENRANIKGEYWSARRLELPQVKFSIQKADKKAGLLNETGLNAYSKNWFLEMARKAATDLKNSHSGFYLEYEKDNYIPYKAESAVKNFYTYYRRHYFVHQRSPDAEYDNYRFMTMLSRFLNKWGLQHEFILAVPKELGTIDQVISPEELYWAIRLKSSGTIIGEFNAYSTLNELSTSVRGTEAYVVYLGKQNKQKGKIYREELPVQLAEDNKYRYNIEVKLLDHSLKVNRINTYSGLARYEHINDLPHFVFDRDYRDLYGSDYGLGLVPYYAFTDQDNLLEKLENLRDRYWVDQFRLASREMGNRLKNPYFEIKDYKLLKITDGARSERDPTLIFEEEYEAKGLVSRAENRLVIDIGRLLGTSFTLFDSEDTLRLTGIDHKLPRTVEHILYFDVPEGYTYKGLEQFDTLVNNETGSYEIRFEKEAGGFTIRTTRIYKAAYFDKSHWPAVKELVDINAFINAKHIILIQSEK